MPYKKYTTSLGYRTAVISEDKAKFLSKRINNQEYVMLFNDDYVGHKIFKHKLPKNASLVKYNSHNGGLDTYVCRDNTLSRMYPKRPNDKDYSDLLYTTIQLKKQNKSMCLSAKHLLQYKTKSIDVIEQLKTVREELKKQKEQHQTSLSKANDYIIHLQNKLKQTELDEELADEQRHRYRTKYLKKFDEQIALKRENEKLKRENEKLKKQNEKLKKKENSFWLDGKRRQ